MTKSILTSIALSALIVPFFSNASEVATVSPTVTPVTFTISVELPTPSIETSVKAQAQQNLLTDQHNPNKVENALLVNLYEGESALN